MLMSSSPSISISSQRSSFTWDAAAAAAAETCCCCCLSPAADRDSPLLWPAAAFVPTQRRAAGTAAADQRPAATAGVLLRLSCGGSWPEGDDEDVRMAAHWVTTDSDCKFLVRHMAIEFGNSDSMHLRRNTKYDDVISSTVSTKLCSRRVGALTNHREMRITKQMHKQSTRMDGWMNWGGEATR
jgi:hypothetical protein